jgi:hypothetical protein
MEPTPQPAPDDTPQEDLTFESLKNIPEKESKTRMALYINKPIAREFKKLAIDEGIDFSSLAELVFTAFLKSRNRIK